jgi:hypothetical protein
VSANRLTRAEEAALAAAAEFLRAGEVGESDSDAEDALIAALDSGRDKLRRRLGSYEAVWERES